jgi:hypothetical protein
VINVLNFCIVCALFGLSFGLNSFVKKKSLKKALLKANKTAVEWWLESLT